jgi:hypothetical protein
LQHVVAKLALFPASYPTSLTPTRAAIQIFTRRNTLLNLAYVRLHSSKPRARCLEPLICCRDVDLMVQRERNLFALIPIRCGRRSRTQFRCYAVSLSSCHSLSLSFTLPHAHPPTTPYASVSLGRRTQLSVTHLARTLDPAYPSSATSSKQVERTSVHDLLSVTCIPALGPQYCIELVFVVCQSPLLSSRINDDVYRAAAGVLQHVYPTLASLPPEL